MAERERTSPGLPAKIFGTVLLLLGLLLTVGGIWLIAVGGSLYYLAAGLLMGASGALLFLGLDAALWVYAALVVLTVIWAIAEIGFDWWQLVPRGDIVFILGVIMLLPWFAGRLVRGSVRWGRIGLSLSLLVAAVVGVIALFTTNHDLEGRLPGPRGAVPANYAGVPDGDWSAYGRSLHGDKFSPLTQITPANVKHLKVAWQIETGDRKRLGDPVETTYEVTPLKIGNTVYLCTPHDWVLAVDAETGARRWTFDPHIFVSKHLQHLTCRGVSYHDAAWPGATRSVSGECPHRLLLATNDARLIAIDANTGQPCRSFGQNGAVNLWPGMPAYQQGWYQSTSAPLVTKGLVIVAGAIYDNMATMMPSGVIRAYDVATGRLVWNFDPGNPGSTAPIPPGQHYSWSSPNSWSTAAADEQLGLLYLPMGMGAVDEWGGNRPATTEKFATSVLALDIATGQPRWLFQTVHHDLWDMDVPAQPALVDLTIPGRGTIPALVQSTKTGNLFVLDRRTGQPIHPVVEKPVPGGPAPGDHLSPTQPYSSVSLMPERPIREADMWGVTPFDQLACRIRFRSLRYEGPFTPPSEQGTLVFPGNFGVMDWGGIAIDPVRQIAFGHPNYMGFVDKLVPRQNPRDYSGEGGPTGGSDRNRPQHGQGWNPNRGAPFAVYLNPFLSAIGLPCQAPPWGYVAGVDLVTGKTVYKHKNGTIQDESPVPLPIKMGVPSLGGPMVTAGGLAFLTSTLDYYIRAYDTETGHELWRARLPAGAQATPMSYWSPASRRQFVIAVAGGHGSLGTKLGDYVIAYALPNER